jgi:imidazolonepropionase-like amidohydrolase
VPTAIAGALLSLTALGQPIVAVTHVTVIDGTGAKPKSDQTVLVKGERIAAVGNSRRVKVPEGATSVSGRGKFLIPGLWDMHVHLTDIPNFGELNIANGVTGVRDMFGWMTNITAARKAIAEGKPGPRIVAAGPMIDGPKPVFSDSLTAKNAEEARKAVQFAKQDGSDFIKVYQLLPRDAYFAIADETKRQGMIFAGHVPDAVSVSEASNIGQRSIEHLTGVLKACSSREAELMRSAQTAFAGQRDLNTVKILEDTYDENKARVLFARLKHNRTWQCPTMLAMFSSVHLKDVDLMNDSRLRYLDAETSKFWMATQRSSTNWLPEVWKALQQDWRRRQKLVGAMRRAGVGFLAGTDTPNPFCFPGFSLHDELAQLVVAGLTPMEVLQAATFNPVKYLGREKDLGSIQPGKLADLVLLDADPLQDIHNTRKIHAVFANGRLFDRPTLDRLLCDAERAAKPAMDAN